MTKSFIIEALTVGVVTAIIGFIISTLLMLPSKDFSWSKYHFWPSVLFSFFITGVIIHVIFEVSGANKWYCKNGNACQL